jgi:hypothetical protein
MLKNLIIILIILGVVFIGQQYFSKEPGDSLFAKTANTTKGFWSTAEDWFKTNVYPRVSQEAQNRGEEIKNELQNQKEKISESVGEKIKNYFTNVVDSVLNIKKDDSNIECSACQTQCQPAQTSP